MLDRLRRRGDLLVPAIYAVLALAVAAPLLAPGFVLTLDFAPTPDPGIPESYWGIPEGTHVGPPSRLPLELVTAGFGEVGLAAVAEKLLLLAIVFLAGWGMHRLVRDRVSAAEAAVFAGVLFAINPFVYDRLITGQWYLLLGYALLPHAYRAFIGALERRGRLAPWIFGALFIATGAASPHMAALLLVLCVFTLLAWAPKIRRDPGILRAPAAALALGLLPSLYWLLPTPGVEDLWRHVGSEQLELYRSVGDEDWGLLATLAGLSGYWNNPDPMREFLPVWPLLTLTLLVLSAWGAALRRAEGTTWAVAAAGILGLVLALGEASAVTRDAYTFLLDEIAPLRSFREPQKGVALLAFAYAFLSAFAVDDFLAHPPRLRHGRTLLAAAVIALPLLFGFRLFGGLWGELETSDYPSSWAEADEVLEREAADSRTLFLPWHGYLVLDFADGRVVANPAPGYFHSPILSSRSVGEGAGLADESDPVEDRVNALVNGGGVSGLGACLAPLGVTHVLLAKTADWKRYGYLDDTDLVLERRWNDLLLYRSPVPSGPVMRGDALASEECRRDLEPLGAGRESPVRYSLDQEAPDPGELVLGLPLAEDWSADGDEVRFDPWDSYRRNYLLGLAGLVVFLVSLSAGLGLGKRLRRHVKRSD